MTIPRLAEYIQSIRRPTGEWASEYDGGQVIVASFPANTAATTTISPAQYHYALASYKVSFGSNMVPSAFTISAQQHGHTVISGYITSQILQDGLSMFMMLTHSEPATYTITNTTAVVQYCELSSEFSTIHSKEDYDLIIKGLDDLANAGFTDALVAYRAILKTQALKTQALKMPPPFPVMVGR